MADPFSITGTAVGITSLGLQVCQGLVQYYTQFKCFHHDVSAAIERAQRLAGILNILQDYLRKSVEDEASAIEAWKSILACDEGLKRLQHLVKKYEDLKLPENLEDKLKLAQERLLYPFKKDSLDELNNKLDRLQANLQVALQALQL